MLAADADDAAVLAAMIESPVLVERPIVETPKGAAIGRPVEAVLGVL
ncbi:ArsC/Spx/MgsR family protein [Klebsiella pneumoniae]|nr:ArsC/Spx/MgsR family protein [Klebsiella pneumoniae]MDP0965089.1 ArsC/Spx/MgsR family protein [Klebsiella pneumoniae]